MAGKAHGRVLVNVCQRAVKVAVGCKMRCIQFVDSSDIVQI